MAHGLKAVGIAMAGLVLWTGTAAAQTFSSGSTGADGALNPTANVTLSLPASGVFNFTTINIPAGVIVRFSRNAANTPATLLASGDVTIAGIIDVSGANGGIASFGTNLVPNGGRGGPGGFDGGSGSNGLIGTAGGSGLGPGGGAGGFFKLSDCSGIGGGGGFARQGGTAQNNAGNLYAVGGPSYGSPALLPLIGGSGGGGGGSSLPPSTTGSGGGGGGGALAIMSSGTITFTGTLLARGGNTGSPPFFGDGPTGGGGSGGAVRMVAAAITGSGGSVNVSPGAGSGVFTCFSGSGSPGRIRVEAFSTTAVVQYSDVPTCDQPGAVPLPSAPALSIVSAGGFPAPASPTGSFATPDIMLPAGTTSPVTANLSAVNIPPGSAVTITVKGLSGGDSSSSAVLSGTLTASSASASVTIPTNEPFVLSASTSFSLASLGGGPVYVEGEDVERVRVTATVGGPMQIAYITRSGREVRVGLAR
jgi:hypothetical protein